MDEFASLWERRTTLQNAEGDVYEVLGLEDLVQAKKTQRKKDWPMIQALVDFHYEQNCVEPTAEQVQFWLRESRTPEILIQLVAQFPDLAADLSSTRGAVRAAAHASRTAVQAELDKEEAAIREEDCLYWEPLQRELEQLGISGGQASNPLKPSSSATPKLRVRIPSLATSST